MSGDVTEQLNVLFVVLNVNRVFVCQFPRVSPTSKPNLEILVTFIMCQIPTNWTSLFFLST